MTIALSTLAVALAYLIGSIPTAFLVVKAIKGVDIRTVGSGNVGATNAARVLGVRFFPLVFGLDLLKGFLPTWGLPRLLPALGESAVPSLAVFAAVAAILGHNFPIYLGFRGGKGVAASLGAVIALDPLAAGSAAFAFAVFLILTRIVSISSILAGLAFVLVHFMMTRDPWSREQVALSIAVLLLLTLLIVRHRANLVRILRGNEPRISLGRRKPPAGRVAPAVVVVLALAALGVGTLFHSRLTRPAVLDCGRFRLVVADRVQTNLQRAERLAFYDEGRRLVVTCPRYDRIVLYDISDASRLRKIREVRLGGKPMAVWPTAERLYVLQRPSGDARHLVPGFWEVLDHDGEPAGPKFELGWDPDDLALTADGLTALVLLSGHAEGEANRPDPELLAVDLSDPERPRIMSRHVFDHPGDDPERIVLSEMRTHAAVVLRGSGEVEGFDLFDRLRPEPTGRVPLPGAELPYISKSDDDSLMMPVASGREAVRIAPLGEPSARHVLVGVATEESGLEVVDLLTRRRLGMLPLRGPANLGSVRPLSLAYAPGRGLIAVADRSGGVHLVAIQDSEGPPRAMLPAAIRDRPRD